MKRHKKQKKKNKQTAQRFIMDYTVQFTVKH